MGSRKRLLLPGFRSHPFRYLESDRLESLEVSFGQVELARSTY
jgi:hypothetical protein